MNNVTLIGRAGADPEVRYLDSGNVVVKIRVAVPSGKQDEVAWVQVESWGKLAQVIADHARKGTELGITGTLKENRWVDKETRKNRSSLYVKAMSIDLLRKPSGEPEPAESQGYEDEW